MYNVEKQLHKLQKSCGVNTARFLKYVGSFFKIMHERFKLLQKMKQLKQRIQTVFETEKQIKSDVDERICVQFAYKIKI